MNQIKIRINGEEYLIKKTFRSLMMFEEQTGRSVTNMKESVNDLLLLFWCILSSCNKDKFTFTFNEFLDVIDENPESVDVFSEYLASEAEKNLDNTSKKKKKVS